MVSSDPRDGVTLLARGITMPPQEPATWRAWNGGPFPGSQVCTWEQFPDVLRNAITTTARRS